VVNFYGHVPEYSNGNTPAGGYLQAVAEIILTIGVGHADIYSMERSHG
jgi:hypothetical protein